MQSTNNVFLLYQLFRSLFEQFRRVANFYFLMISILMLIGTYTSLFDTPYKPWSTLFVLFIVVTISVVKGGLEDLKRHAADRLSNHRLVEKLLPNGPDDDFELIEWRHVRVGDILRVTKDSEMPADIVMLLSSEKFGSAYIETSNIDGEGNLKVKNSAPTGDQGEGPLWIKPADLRRWPMFIVYDYF
jgi:magnesium-transporting ATPase (P-type)